MRSGLEVKNRILDSLFKDDSKNEILKELKGIYSERGGRSRRAKGRNTRNRSNIEEESVISNTIEDLNKKLSDIVSNESHSNIYNFDSMNMENSQKLKSFISYLNQV